VLLFKSADCAFVAFAHPEIRRNGHLLNLTLLFAALAVFLFVKPRYGRWTAGAYFILMAWLSLSLLVKPGNSPSLTVLYTSSAAVGAFLAYGLMRSASVNAYISEKN
jgi:hypothetical protein